MKKGDNLIIITIIGVLVLLIITVNTMNLGSMENLPIDGDGNVLEEDSSIQIDGEDNVDSQNLPGRRPITTTNSDTEELSSDEESDFSEYLDDEANDLLESQDAAYALPPDTKTFKPYKPARLTSLYPPDGGCSASTCDSNCKTDGFYEGSCLDDVCFCLNKLEEEICSQTSCTEECAGEGVCTADGCVCSGALETVRCRSFGNAEIENAGTVVYYYELSHAGLVREPFCSNYMYLDNVVCKQNSAQVLRLRRNLDGSILAEYSEDYLQTLITELNKNDCSAKTCDKAYQKGFCVIDGCECKPYVDKAFIQEAVNRFLIDPNTAITKADIETLISLSEKIDANDLAFTSIEETQYENAIVAVKAEMENPDSLQINYDLLY